MESLIWTLIVRSLLALLLAALGSASARWSGRPGMTYAVCALAIAVLLAPPLFEVAVLPAPATSDTPQVAGTGAEPLALPAPFELPKAVDAKFNLSIGRCLVALWGVGSVGILALGLWRLRRFSSALGKRRPASGEMQAAIDRLGRTIGLRNVPRVRLTQTPVTPLLRQRGATLEILFPAGLLPRLTRDERDTLLTHELMHVRRKDHWMRLFEFAGTTIFWWHPAVWWARRQLRRAEEQLCDRQVLAHLPHLRAAYARGLFKTAEYLAGADRHLPALASGAGETRFLKERLMMIVERRKTRMLSNGQRILLTLLATGLLVFLPTWAERAPEEPPRPADASIESGQRMLELERQARELEMRLAELRAEQEALRVRDPELTSEWAVALAESPQMETRFRRAAETLEARARELEIDARRRQLERQAEIELLSRESQGAAVSADERRSIEAQMELALRKLELDRRRQEADRDVEISRAFEAEAAARMLALESLARAPRDLERALARRLEALAPAVEQQERQSTHAEIERLNQLVEELKMRLERTGKDGR